MLRAGVAREEHVIRHATQLDLRLPHARPQGRIVIDVTHHRRLGADHHVRFAQVADGLANRVVLQFARVVEVRHQRQLLAGIGHLAEQRQHLRRVLVVHELVRPVTQHLGADADVDQIGQIGRQQRFDIGGEVLR